VCGCYGTRHKALTNCLYCGRISCTLEGYDFCSFCGYMVEEVKADGPYVMSPFLDCASIFSCFLY
jgi:hypothetical protein